MKSLIIPFLLISIFISCNHQNNSELKQSTDTETLALKELDIKSEFGRGIEFYVYDESLYQDEHLPSAIYDTKIGLSDSIMMTLNYGVTIKAGFGASTATLTLLNKGVIAIDSTAGNIESMEKWFYDLSKKFYLKNPQVLDLVNFKSDTIQLLESNCDTTLTKHYPTYEGDNIIRRQTKDSSLLQFYYSGIENRINICREGKNYDLIINNTDSIMRHYPTIFLRDITGDNKEELFFAETMRPFYWPYDGYYIDIYEIIYPIKEK